MLHFPRAFVLLALLTSSPTSFLFGATGQSHAQVTTTSPKIGVIAKPTLGECGCSLQLPADYAKQNDRYVFQSNVDGRGKINVDGTDLELNLVRRSETTGATKVGDRTRETLEAKRIRVEIEYLVTKVCDPDDESCEQVWYSATITVTRNRTARRVRVRGACGC